MKKNIVILGTGGFAKEVAFLIERINKKQSQWNLLGFIDTVSKTEKLMGYPILGDDDWLLKQRNETYIACGIGNGIVRKKVIDKYKHLDGKFFPNLIDPSVIISDYFKIGKGNIICAGTIITVDVILGDFVTINLDCTIGHDTEIGDYVTINPSTNVSGNVKIQKYTEIGTGTQIIQGLNVGCEVVIGAGTVVIRDVPKQCTIVGNPARIVKRKSVES